MGMDHTQDVYGSDNGRRNTYLTVESENVFLIHKVQLLVQWNYEVDGCGRD